MAFGSQMDDSVNLFILHELVERLEVADIHANELIIWFVLHIL